MENEHKEMTDIEMYCVKNCLTLVDCGLWHSAKEALELMSHIKDRPCEACEYHKENGCTQWTCVFDKYLYSKVYGKERENDKH